MTPLEADPVYQRIRRAFMSDVHKIDAGIDPAPGWRDRGYKRKQQPGIDRDNDRWTELDDENLYRMKSAGYSESAIASRLGRTPLSIKARWAKVR